MVNTLATVLLIEDNPDDVEVVSRVLKEVNLINPLKHVTRAEDGLEYLRLEAKPCLVLLDLNMPGIGGLEFLRIVKQDRTTKKIPIIILTCSDHESLVNTCYTYGANAYILKSLDLNILTASLKRMKEYWLDTVMLPSVPDEEYSDDIVELTPHEIETLTWIAKGKNRWEAGMILGVTEDTVKARLERTRRKLKANNTTHAISIALQKGLLFISL